MLVKSIYQHALHTAIWSETSDIPTRYAIEIEESQVGVLDNMANTSGSNIAHFVQVDGLQLNCPVSQQF